MDGTFFYQVGADLPILFLKLDFGNLGVMGTHPNFNLAGVGFLLSQVVEFLYGHCALPLTLTFRMFSSRLRGILPIAFHSAKHMGAINAMASNPFLCATSFWQPLRLVFRI
jgi:hypothetical protein